MASAFETFDEFSEEDDEENFIDDTLDFSRQNLAEVDTTQMLNEIDDPSRILTLHLDSTFLSNLPNNIERFQSLISVELSNNRLVNLPPEIGSLKNLKNIFLKNNALDDFSLPKQLEQLKQLEVINLGGNRFKQFPYQLLELGSLREIYLGSNQISQLPNRFDNLTNVEVLYLGGNRISRLPESIGSMNSLVVLNLCDNRLKTLPRTISQLTRLKSLSLHNNQFCALPSDIIRLDLQELSLRNNPLVVRFVRDLTYDVPRLKELTARTIKFHHLHYNEMNLPKSLVEYLNTAKSCLNPKCQGVYFETFHKNIKFVDFCGKFYLPLLQFLCSPACTSTTTACPLTVAKSNDMDSKFKKVLLG